MGTETDTARGGPADGGVGVTPADKVAQIADLVQAFDSGALARDDYWRAMQQWHLRLLEYCSLVRRAQLDRIELDAAELRVVLGNGLKLRWRPEDIRTVPNILVNHGDYEGHELALLQRLARSCAVVLDVGANIGWYSLHLAHALRETGVQIYAFEPIPRTFAELTHNIGLNGYGDTIHAFNHALGESAGSVEFYVPAFTGSVAASQRPLFPQDHNEAVECQIVPLDTFVREQQLTRVDLIKCDVEGSEIFALRGGLDTIARHRPIIMLEMLRKWSAAFGYHPNDVIALLSQYGYQCWSLEAGQIATVAAVDETCVQTNFFFLHANRHAELLAQLSGSAEGRASQTDPHGSEEKIES